MKAIKILLVQMEEIKNFVENVYLFNLINNKTDRNINKEFTVKTKLKLV